MLAPFAYTQIIWMTLSGIVLFGDWPDRVTLLGAAIIIASGAYVWHREKVRGATVAMMSAD
jgi:drug/metabolite transporter (DMT)-like permease